MALTMQIGEQIRAARERKGLSVLELAVMAKVGINTLYKAEAGKSVPRRAVLLRLAKIIDIPTGVEVRLVRAAA